MRTERGLTLAEAVLAIGILSLALFALISVCTMALRFQRQSLNDINAARVTDKVLGRSMASVLGDQPPGEQAIFWAGNFPFPNTPYKTGVERVGRNQYSWAVYASDIAGVTTIADNRLRRVDAYVWWEDPDAGTKIVSATRLLNEGEEP